ncbi:MAG: phosphate acyltransferase PlsX [Elusimicrobiota bacterium]
MKIAVDAMGGDHAPQAIVKGVVQAAEKFGQHTFILVGDETKVEAELNANGYNGNKIEVRNATQVIGMDEHPGRACRQKRDSSIMVATKLVAEGVAQAVVSAGSSGAQLASALIYLHRLPGISRPAIISPMPTKEGGFSIVLDVGANVDCKPKYLLEFAIMGSMYLKCVYNRESPKVGLLSIGEEDAKGNELTLATFELLKNSKLNFVGNIEGYDILKGKADIIVCDGFVGNVVLKLSEGLAEFLFSFIKSKIVEHPIRAAFAALTLNKVFKDIKKLIDFDEYGGMPLLGINGTSIVCHGKSTPKAIVNAINVAAEFTSKGVNEQIVKLVQQVETKEMQKQQETDEEYEK